MLHGEGSSGRKARTLSSLAPSGESQRALARGLAGRRTPTHEGRNSEERGEQSYRDPAFGVALLKAETSLRRNSDGTATVKKD